MLLGSLSQLVARIDTTYSLVNFRVARTSLYSMVVDLKVCGSVAPAPEYRLTWFGMKPILIKPLAPRKPCVPVTHMAPGARTPLPSRPLSAD